MKLETIRSLSAITCILGGITWVLLGPAAVLERNNILSYDSYNRLLTLPLLLFLVGFIAAEPRLRPRTMWGTVGFVLVALGLFLLLVGNALEYWGCCCSPSRMRSWPTKRVRASTGLARTSGG